MVKAIMTLIPSIGVALSLVIIYFYPIDAKMHKDLLRQLQENQTNNKNLLNPWGILGTGAIAKAFG